MPTLIVAGLGTTQWTYRPPITDTSDVVTVHSQTVFVPVVPTSDGSARLLVSAQTDGTFETACTGTVTDQNVHGVLHWSDGTTSAFSLDAPTASARVQGHGVAHSPGTITSGYYQGARVDFLGVNFAGDVTACLSGRGVSTATGCRVCTVTMP